MKKTIITAALCLGMAAAASAATYTLGDVNYTTTTGFGSGSGNYWTSSFTFTLSDSLFAGTADTTNAITTATGTADTFTSSVGLNSIMIVYRASNLSDAAPAEMSSIRIIDTSDNSTIGTSSSVTVGSNTAQYNIFNDKDFYTRNTLTYNFSALNTVLSKGTTYRVEFLSNDGSLTTSNKVGIVSAPNGTSYDFATLANGADRQPGGMVISTTSLNPVSTPAIPEPTTATLSLLALAGLAARRRRK